MEMEWKHMFDNNGTETDKYESRSFDLYKYLECNGDDKTEETFEVDSNGDYVTRTISNSYMKQIFRYVNCRSDEMEEQVKIYLTRKLWEELERLYYSINYQTVRFNNNSEEFVLTGISCMLLILLCSEEGDSLLNKYSAYWLDKDLLIKYINEAINGKHALNDKAMNGVKIKINFFNGYSNEEKSKHLFNTLIMTKKRFAGSTQSEIGDFIFAVLSNNSLRDILISYDKQLDVTSLAKIIAGYINGNPELYFSEHFEENDESDLPF